MITQNTKNIIRKLLNLVFMLCVTIGAFTSQAQTASIHQKIQLQTDKIFDSLVSIRRDLHMYPEVGGEEKRTSALVANYLSNLGLEVKTGIGGYGVIGILNTGKPGKKIAWRADIDAIASHAKETRTFGTKIEGVRHICGHDVHTAMALGMANILTENKADLSGTIYFIFQPSEETFTGAKSMLADGIFDIISPDEIYAAHMSPMPVGTVASKPNYLYADYKQLNVTFESDTKDEALITFTQKAIKELQNVAPDSEFWDVQNLMDPEIGIGNPETIFKDYITVDKTFRANFADNTLTITGYVSASNKALMQGIPDRLREKIKASEYGTQLRKINFHSEQITFSTDRGNIDNNPTLTNESIQAIAKIYGPAAFPLYGAIPDGRGDDFSYFQEKVPGVYFLMGGSNFEKGIISMPHAPNFAVDESCINTGVKYFSSLIVERLMK